MVFGYGVGGVAVDPQNPDILYTGPYDLHVSTDGGATWTVRNNGLTCHQIYSIAINPTNPSIVFAAGFISQNIFVTKLNPSGGIVFSTYLGGTGGARWLGDSKYAGGIAVDSSGNVYVDGATYSDDFPITTNAYQTLHAGNIYLSKFNATGSQLLYSTCFGSDSYESGNGVAVDNSGKAYIAGQTESGLPLRDEFQVTPFGAFVAKFDTKLSGDSSLLYSSYLGASGGYDRADAISIDTTGSAYVVGRTNASDFPVVNAFQNAFAGGYSDGFITKISEPPPLKGLKLNPSVVPGTKTSLATLTLTAVAPVNEGPIFLTSTNTAIATVPTSLTVLAGTSSVTFTVNTTAVTASQVATITASYGGKTVSANLTVRPIGVKTLTVTPSTISSTNNAIGIVTLEAKAAPGDIVVTLSSSDPAVANPSVSTVTVSSGKSSAAFNIDTFPVTVTENVTITATANGISKSAKLTVNP